MSEKRLTPSDAMFLYGETRETMMHVGSLLIFTPPKDAGPEFLRRVVDELKETRAVYPPWNLKLRTPEFLRNPVPSWIEDKEFDIDYHLRRSALPSPCDERELGILVSRLHSNSIDFHHPPWEAHIIEGLEGGRFAIYVKIHHSLVDGFTGARLLARSLSTDPAERDRPLFIGLPAPDAKPAASRETPESGLESVLSVLRSQFNAAKQVGKELLNIVEGREKDVVLPFQAPMSILNGRISRNRRFATQQYPLQRLKTLAKSGGGTLNDIIMGLSAGSLRKFLLEMNALPADPLIAMIPVSVRPKDDPGGGNSVGSLLVNLATHIEDPVERLEAIKESARHAKAQLTGMSKEAIIQFSALLMSPILFQQVTGTSGRVRPPYNVVISNVPGPEVPLYFRGARLEASYPLSIPFHGQAYNITCTSYAGTMNFGFTGCRDSIPHMQRLAVYTGDALEELETALSRR